MNAPEISVVCPVTRHSVLLGRVHTEFVEALMRIGRSAEIIYVFDGPRSTAKAALSAVDRGPYPVRFLQMAKGFGEATALATAFARVRGRLVITIPDRPQIDAGTLDVVLEQLDAGASVVVTRRDPRRDARLNRMQSGVFHALVRRLVRQNFQDMSCGLRGFTAEAARRLDLYGDQHRFLPVIAVRNGYAVVEVAGPQHPDNTGLRLRKPGVYVRRLLDILNIYFLTRFTRKPLRFFGLIGLTVGAVGFVISGYLAALRLLGLSALADRPLLLLGVLLIVLGVQVTSIGLLGEIIIFLSTRREMPQVVEGGGTGGEDGEDGYSPPQVASTTPRR